eukprot:2986278-Pleurochrysis_carterae.AAC.5
MDSEGFSLAHRQRMHGSTRSRVAGRRKLRWQSNSAKNSSTAMCDQTNIKTAFTRVSIISIGGQAPRKGGKHGPRVLSVV